MFVQLSSVDWPPLNHIPEEIRLAVEGELSAVHVGLSAAHAYVRHLDAHNHGIARLGHLEPRGSRHVLAKAQAEGRVPPTRQRVSHARATAVSQSKRQQNTENNK